MTLSQQQPSAELVQRVAESDNLINEAYDLALDPNLFHDFAQSWVSFSEQIEAHSDGEERERLHGAMTRHFKRAFLLAEKIGRQHKNSDPVSKQIAQRSSPTFELDREGRILIANQAARNVFSANLDKTRHPHTIWQLFQDNTRSVLQAAIQAAVQSNNSQRAMVLLGNGIPCLLVINPVSNSPSLIAELLLPTWSDATDAVLATNYQLTAKECEIVAQLFRGLNANQIADQSNKSKDTVRTQIRSILRKTKCDTQAHLMRLLTSIVFLGSQQNRINWFLHSGSAQYLELADGRELEYYDVGDPRGDVVLVLYGIMHTPELNKPVADQLLQNGYRIVGFCRAGYGNSTSPMSWENLLNDSNADVDALLDHLVILCFIVNGWQCLCVQLRAASL